MYCNSAFTFDFVSVTVLSRLRVSLQMQQRKECLKNCFTELLTCMALIMSYLYIIVEYRQKICDLTFMSVCSIQPSESDVKSEIIINNKESPFTNSTINSHILAAPGYLLLISVKLPYSLKY